MTDEELTDLNLMKQNIEEIKIGAIDYQLFLLKNGIQSTRFKSLSEAFAFTVEQASVRIRKLQRDHVKKYPD